MDTIDEGYGGLFGFVTSVVEEDFGGTGGVAQTEFVDRDDDEEKDDDDDVTVPGVHILDVDAASSSAGQVVIGVQTRKSPSLDTCRNSQYGSVTLFRSPGPVVAVSIAAFRTHVGNRNEILSLLILIPNSV